jgi:hypothetical protein
VADLESVPGKGRCFWHYLEKVAKNAVKVARLPFGLVDFTRINKSIKTFKFVSKN